MSTNSKKPKPEDYGIGPDKVSWFDSRLKGGDDSNIIGSVIANIFIFSGVIYFIDDLKPLTFFIIFFIGGSFGLLLGAFIDKTIENYKLKTAHNDKIYKTYLAYKKALSNFESEALNKRINAMVKKEKTIKSIKNELRDKKLNSNKKGILFEKKVAVYFKRKGYIVKFTPISADEGVDLYLFKDNIEIIVQCKAYENYISPGIVRELYGTLLHKQATEAWLVTTSGYYSGCYKFAQNKPIKLLTLKDIV